MMAKNLLKNRLHWLVFILTVPPLIASNLMVTIEQGTLEGTTAVARNGTIFNAYYKIPFARPPVGELRFQPPQPAGPWKGILNATVPATAEDGCVQMGSERGSFTGSEDCLHLNVFTPLNAHAGDNIPVIMYIYGGVFQTGHSAKEGPDYIMAQNIVLVQFNYRLGLFGVFSTGDSVVPGNMALKDQIMAMKWTKKNIHAFGGNPQQITLMGHSGGATCTQLHTYSPLSRDKKLSVGSPTDMVLSSGPCSNL